MDIGLLGRDFERCHILYDRVRSRKAERDLFVLGDSARIQHDVKREFRIGLLEEAGFAHRKRIHWPQVHGYIILGDEPHGFRQSQIGIGAAEGVVEVD
jgi:hypothetical protein